MPHRRRRQFKDLKSFKSWIEAAEELQEVFNNHAESDPSIVSDRLAEIIFNQDLNDFRIRVNFTAEDERRKKR